MSAASQQQRPVANVVTLLPSTLANCLKEIVERTNKSSAGIRAVLLSTTDGVPLGRVYCNYGSSVGGGDDNVNDSDSHQPLPLNEDVLASIESVYAPASKQFPVLGLGGKNLHQVTAIYDHGTLIHVRISLLVVKATVAATTKRKSERGNAARVRIRKARSAVSVPIFSRRFK